MPTAYRPFDEILDKLSLKPASELSSVVDRAWSIQQYRTKAGEAGAPEGAVSRTSLFLACGLVDPGILDLLTSAKYDASKLAAEVGAAGFEPDETQTAPPVSVSHRLAEGLRTYEELEGRSAEVGAQALAYSIVAVPGDVFEKRFKAAGGSISKAAGLLRSNLLAASQQAATKIDRSAVSRGTLVTLDYTLEPHVEQSLRVALVLAGGEPINAGHALRAALVVAKKKRSGGFRKLQSLLEGLRQAPPMGDLPPSSKVRSDLLLEPSLAASLSVADPFLRESTNVWGRDYITLALLAEDPSLDEIAQRLDRPLSKIRDDWFRFVTTSEKDHRTPENWQAWWRAAGVTPPPDPVDTSAYLLTWDPGLYSVKKLRVFARQVAENGSAIMGWSASSGVSVGDRVFLMRHHQDPKGLVGAGKVVEVVGEQKHWNPAEAKKGRTSFMAAVEWETLRELPFVALDDLVSGTGEEGLWTSEGSGLPIMPELAERLEGIWAEAVRGQATGEREGEQTRPRSYISTDAVSPGFGETDFKPSEHDSLKAKEQTEIFAALLVAEEVQLPFALGLLGDWGVGKTFFMRLMQENVDAIAGRKVRTRTPGSVSRAAQIEFNAWHYVDSDLWASLASHIFDNLSEELSPREDDIQETRRELRRRIHSSTREQEEAKAAIERAEDSRQDAASDLAKKQEERKRKESESESLRLGRVWDAIMKLEPSADHKDWPNVAKLKDEAQRTAKRLGVTEAIESAEQAQQALVSLRDLFRRGGGLAQAFASDFSGQRALGASLILLALLALVIGWPWLLMTIGCNPDTPPQFVTSLLRLITMVGPAAIWATRNIKSISSAIGDLETIEREIRKPPPELANELAELSYTEKVLEEEIEELDAQIATQQRTIEEADRQISAAQAEIQRINAGGLVYDFLEGRIRDSRYLDRLGLISVIRKDFERLKRLLQDWQKHGRTAARPTEADTGDHDSQLPPIERIILYIDDLDRCPPKRVVEVLQAVHLLLAFDLFVVVVAVDARWLERSLNESYNPWTKAEADGPKAPVHRFNAHNYLEKIFQIAFSLPPMDQLGYQKLVAKMIATPREEAEKREREEERRRAKREEEEERRAAIDPSKKDGEEQQPVVPASGQGTSKPEENEAARKARLKAEKKMWEEAEEKRRQEEQEEAERRVAAMVLEKSEEKFIAALFPFIGTPRLAKRLVNIYRLLRVGAATRRDPPFSRFIHPDNGEYRAALLLLAIGVGRADVASEILEALGGEGAGSFRKWLKDKAGDFESQRKTRSDLRAARNKATGASVAPSDRENRLGALHVATGRIDEKLDVVIKTLKKIEEAPSFDDRLEVYGRWAREVGRYSFHWHLKPKD